MFNFNGNTQFSRLITPTYGGMDSEISISKRLLIAVSLFKIYDMFYCTSSC